MTHVLKPQSSDGMFQSRLRILHDGPV